MKHFYWGSLDGPACRLNNKRRVPPSWGAPYMITAMSLVRIHYLYETDKIWNAKFKTGYSTMIYASQINVIHHLISNAMSYLGFNQSKIWY